MRVKIVDGFKIRNTIDPDFSIVNDCLTAPYIPKNEIWFDRAFIKEKITLLEAYAKKRTLIKKYGYEKAEEMMRRGTEKSADEVKIKILSKRGPIKIWLVSGKKVREYFDPSFNFGGHWLVYKYIPKNEVWIDNAALARERKYIIIHELFELDLMKEGKKKYNDAHDYATAREKEERRKDKVANYLKD